MSCAVMALQQKLLLKIMEILTFLFLIELTSHGKKLPRKAPFLGNLLNTKIKIYYNILINNNCQSHNAIFSRDSDLRTRFKDVDILKKMWICMNISTSFFNISTSYVTKTNISTSFFNISTSTGMCH